MRSLLLTVVLATFVATASLSQDILVKVDYPTVVAVGEQLRITWTVNATGGEFIAPSFDGFYKLSGPNTSYSSSTQIINGRRTSETSYSYVFYLQALREGKYTIPAAGYTKSGKTYSSEPAEIEVIKDAAGKSTAAGVRDGTNETSTSTSDIFVRLILSKREVYLGEPVAATVKLYTRTDISGINEVKYPSFNGFLKEEIATPQLTSLTRENVDGVIYGTGVFQKFLLYPQKSGEIIIDPVQITVLLRQSGGASDPFFGDFFQSFTTVPKMVASEAARINVKPLPASQPADFMGGVGRFELKAETDRDTLNVNDALNLKIVISGKGNLKLADAPSVVFPAGLEAYDPKMTLITENSETGTTGSKVFEYLIIPRAAGDYTIAPVSYSYFDPGTGDYKRAVTSSFRVHVLKGGAQSASPTVFSPAGGEDIRYLGKDIRFIKTTVPPFRQAANLLTSSRSFFSIYGFALLIFVAIIITRREQVKRNSDRVRVKNRRAGKIASQRLKTARKYLRSSETGKFYEEVLRTIWGYTGDKLNIPVSALTRSRAVDELTARGIEPGLISDLTSLADKCEMVRYSPSASSDPAPLYEEAARIISELEDKLN
jgi:hypothetical protein